MNFIPIILVVVAIIIGLFIKKRKTGSFLFAKKQKHFARVAAPLMRKKKQVIKVDRDTAMARSWDFFTKIANVVIEKFSRSDQEALVKIGLDLQKAGVEYAHVLDFAEIKKSLAPAINKTQDIQKSR